MAASGETIRIKHTRRWKNKQRETKNLYNRFIFMNIWMQTQTYFHELSNFNDDDNSKNGINTCEMENIGGFQCHRHHSTPPPSPQQPMLLLAYSRAQKDEEKK